MGDCLKFEPYEGEMLGLVYNNKHIVFRWNGSGKVLFSITRHGNSMACHFASDKKGLRHIKEAIHDFYSFVFDTFDWCEMMLAVVERPSVGRILERCGSVQIGAAGNDKIYMRLRDG